MENTIQNSAQPSTQNAYAAKYNPKEFVDLADKTYLSYIKDGKYKDIINSMAGLGDYTLRNQMLILSQFPQATKVNSMSAWNFNKRSIQKGSQSIKILAPIFDTVVKSENGQIVEKKSDYISGYKINFVFDISQTDSKEAEKEKVLSKSLEPYYDIILEALKNTLKSYEFKSGEIEGDGILDTRQKTITINQGLTKEQTLKTLIDQVSAALVIGRNRDNFQGLRSDVLPNITAIEISAVSAIVGKRLGFESQGTQNIQEPDFSKMEDSQIEKFANNIGLVRSVSQIMIMAIDNALEETFLLERLSKEASLEQLSDQMPKALHEETHQEIIQEETLNEEFTQEKTLKIKKARVRAEAEMV